MKPLLKRRRLADEVESALRDAMAQGRFGEYMPAEVRLAEMFGVSRITLRQALAKLAREGAIAPNRGRRTRILSAPAASEADTKTGRILFLSPGRLHELSPGVLLVQDLLRSAMEERGFKLDHIPCHAFTQSSVAAALEKLVIAEPADLYLLHQAPSAVQEWFSKRRLPAIVVGTPVHGGELPGVHTDLRATAFHAIRHLRTNGHAPERIGLLIPKIDLPDNGTITAGFIEGGGIESMIVRHPSDGEELLSWIKRDNTALRKKPTAMITAWPAPALALLGTLAFRDGRRIPASLSLVCLYDDPAFAMLVPSVTRYRRPPERYVAILSRLILSMAHGSPIKGSRTLIPDLIKGETVAKPAAAP